MPDETIASLLCGHSERLAIAFNFIQNPVPSRIQIVKNLRVCGDCRELIREMQNCPSSFFLYFRRRHKVDCSNSSMFDRSS